MKKLLPILFICCSFSAIAQHVGIGISTPLMKLHIANTADSNHLLLLDNRTPLQAGITAGMYFKSGDYYTGAIKTTGDGFNTAKLSFYTFAATAYPVLKERMSILDNGNVGINKIIPTSSLDVAGNISVINASTSIYTGNFVNPMSNGKGTLYTRLGSPTGLFINGGYTIVAENDTVTGAAIRAVAKWVAVSAESNFPSVSTISAYNSAASSPTAATFYGNVEIKQTAAVPANSGNLKIEGVLNYPDNAGAGKVLSSDASGNAGWKAAAQKALVAHLTGDQNVPNNTYTQLLFSAAASGGFNDFDPGSLNAATGEFMVPAGEGGVYEVSAEVKWSNPNAFVGHLPFTLSIYKNSGSPINSFSNYLGSDNTDLGNRQMKSSVVVRLVAGDKIFSAVTQTSGVAATVFNFTPSQNALTIKRLY